MKIMHWMGCLGVRSLLLCLMLGLSIEVHAQGAGAAANIRGMVTDASGGAVAKATVIAENTEKGIRRTASTDESGNYVLAGLLPTSYDITVEHPSFATEVRKDLVLTVGETAVLDFHLKVASITQVIEVEAAPPTVDTERGSQADTLEQTYIQDLPIDRRDYLTFTLLVPGVSNSSRLADDQNFRVKQFGTSGLSFYGSNGRGNSVTVDGGEANDDEGGVRLTLSQDAVQEFQVNRSNYSAELGGASGASINIVSKSGSNDVHGSLYGFFRNDAMDARDPFAFGSALAPNSTFSTTAVGVPVKNSLSRQQYGGAIGFPIEKDRTFLFAAFEGLRQNAQNAVPLLTSSSIFAGPSIAGNTLPSNLPSNDPRLAQQGVIQALAAGPHGNAPVPCLNNSNGTVITVPATICAGLLQGALAITPGQGLLPNQPAINSFIVNQFENNGGVFPYDTRQYLASGRLDHHLSNNDQIYLRYNYGHDLEESPDVQSLTGFSRGSSIHAYNHTLQAAWFHQFSTSTQNEARVQWSYNNANVIPNEPAEVGLDIAGFANLGTNIFLPNYEILRRYEFADNVTLIRGRHTMTFGGEELLRGNSSSTAVFLPGRFEFGPLPGGLVSDCLLPTPLNPCGINTPGANLNSLQNVSLGLPIFLQDGFGNPTYAHTRPFTAAFWQDSWTMPNFTLNYGLRYEMDMQYLPLNSQEHNFAPRISFAWDPFKDHKTVIRGGYGMFYSQVYDAIPGVDQALGVLNKNRSAVENQGASGPGSQIANLTATCGILAPGGTVIGGNGSSPCNRQIRIYVDPISFPVAGDNSSAVFNYLFTNHNPGQSGPGGIIGCATPPPGEAACITPADLFAAAQSGANSAPGVPLGLFPATNSGPVPALSVLFSNDRNYRSPYSQQAEFAIEREIGQGFVISANYIYSHTVHLPVAIDTNVQDPGFVSATLANGNTVSYRDWNSNPALDPLGQTTAKCAGAPQNCFYNPLIVQNNQYTSAASALYQGGILEVRKRFNGQFTVMGSYTFSKAFDTTTDFNSDYGPQDNLNLNAERALSNFDERHKVVIAGVFDSPWKGALSGFELSPIVNYNSGHPFNLLSGEATNGDNHPTNGRPIGAPRDSGLGPDYVDFDARLGWRHKLRERTSLEITAEGFNLANHTNYASVNNLVGPLFAIPAAEGGAGSLTFNVHGHPGDPSQPLSFTSDFPKREIQLGARLTF